MIKNVFYTDGMTYIKDMKEKEVTTQTLGFAKSFDFAWKNNVEFDYDSINQNDEQDFSRFLQYQVGSCTNRNIYDFFKLCDDYGIKKIINNNEDLFGRKAVRQTISKIVDDYNSDVAIYNIECYGTDTYIAQVVYEHLMLFNSSNKDNSIVYALLKIVDCDDYNLDVFLDILKRFSLTNPDNNTLKRENKMKQEYKKIKTLKNSNNSFNKCKALCDIGKSFYYSMTDSMLCLNPKEKVIKNILHCFNEIFKCHAVLNYYNEAGLTFYLFDEVNDDLIKQWIDKAGHEAIFYDLASTGEYEDYKIIVVDYQLEEYQFIGHKNPAIVFDIILETCLILKENDNFFGDNNDEINSIIDKYIKNILK